MSEVTYGNPRFTFDTVTSTNDIAREWAKNGIPTGALLIASHQTKGRGRRGAEWDDAPGESAIMTFVARPSQPLPDAWKLSYAASLAVHNAVRSLGVQGTGIKWPNDLVHGDAKFGGILVETVAMGSEGYAALVGIGVNVAQNRFDATGYVLPPTSLSIIAGSNAPIVMQTVDAVARELGSVMALLEQSGGWETLFGHWKAAVTFGRKQSGVDERGGMVEGLLRDVRVIDGAAVIETADGELIAATPTGGVALSM